MTNSDPELPPSSSPILALAHPTENEKYQTWALNGKSWAGQLSIEAYIRREEHLGNQAFTRNGGITYWILVDSSKAPDSREILASCESLRKRALIARAEEDGSGDVEEIISHGIGSVFCNPRFRGKGYGRRMIEDLADKLDTWQQPDGRKTDFTVLYSDIGKRYYARSGWQPCMSSHISLSPVAHQEVADEFDYKPRLLRAGDLQQLCLIDEAYVIKKGMVAQSAKAGKTFVCLVPDWETLQWHHAREEFIAKELLGGKVPEIKGAYIQLPDRSSLWCVWTRIFGSESNSLHILRLAIEGEEELSAEHSHGLANGEGGEKDRQKVLAIASLLREAQAEAAKWDMKDVHVWNPTPLVVQAAQKIEPQNAGITHREEESIASLRWHQEDSTNIEWLGNEKYGWC